MVRSNGTCPHCGCPVVLAITAAGRRQYLELEPDPDGNTAAYRDGIGTWHARRPGTERPIERYEDLFIPHYAVSRPCGQRALELARARRKSPTPPPRSNARSNNYRRTT